MKPSEQFVADAHASFEAWFVSKANVLRPYVNERILRPEAAEGAMADYVERLVDHAVGRLRGMLFTYPDNFPEEAARSMLAAMIGSEPNPDTLVLMANLAIHPPPAEMH